MKTFVLTHEKVINITKLHSFS